MIFFWLKKTKSFYLEKVILHFLIFQERGNTENPKKSCTQNPSTGMNIFW